MDVFLGSFVWDSNKERNNLAKHGVGFARASQAFFDPQRQVFKDSKRSQIEERYFCIGKADGRVLTVRFVHREDKIRIIGAAYWRKGREFYEKENS